VNVFEYSLSTGRQSFHDITRHVEDAVKKSVIKDGIAVVFCPHTTTAITINENADPDVTRDLLLALDATYPDRGEFRHGEGNSAAHLKSSCVGVSETIIVRDGSLLLGTWQGIYFCEFDGPRSRRFYVKVM